MLGCRTPAPRSALTAARIPYRIVGGTRFFDRAEVKDCLAYLALAVNPSDGSTRRASDRHVAGRTVSALINMALIR